MVYQFSCLPENWSERRNKFFNIFFVCFQFKIQFDDSLTATFEYPSETSLMIDEPFEGEDDEVDASFYGRSNTNSSSSKLLTSVPLGK